MNKSSWVKLSATWLSCMVIVLVTSPGDVTLQAAEKTRANASKTPPANVPAAIAAEAKRRGIALHNIKLQGEHWVGCDGVGSEATCIVLGRATLAAIPTTTAPAPAKLTGLSSGAVLEVHQYGQAVRQVALVQSQQLGRVSRATGQGLSFELHPGIQARVTVQGHNDLVIDALPRYRREGVNLVRTRDLKLVRDTIDARPNEPFTVIVTVPALCEPCRRLDKLVHDNLGTASKGSGRPEQSPLATKVFILEYFSFADAERELLGSGAVFPTTLVYRVETQPRQSVSRLIGNLRGSSMADISRPLAERFRRGAPHTMSQGVIAQELLFQPVVEQLTRR